MDQRRYDLDWLRIAAFGVLIFYHVGMFYVTWDWHVKSRHASALIEPLMGLSSPWRLTLLFLISGVATRFMADRTSAGKLTLNRMGRLWPPLLLAIFVIVPPQSYYEVRDALDQMHGPSSPWLDNFYLKYVTASGGWCDADGCLTTPTYNHMWFVAYLILYTLALIPLLPLLRRLPARLGVLIRGPGLILTPWAFLAIARLTLFPIFGSTHDFRADTYLHTIYMATFVFGFGIAKHAPFFESCLRWRRTALALGLASWAALQIYYASYPGDAVPPEALRQVFRVVHELQAWTMIVAAIGFAHRYLRTADGPWRKTLSVAIFPVYLIHQTIIVVLAYHLDKLSLPVALEVTLLLSGTALGSWLFYETGRRIPWLRIWIGLPSGRNSPAPAPAPVMAR
jgi:surface polysaccharide O-acyltransferase-like enzyme